MKKYLPTWYSILPTWLPNRLIHISNCLPTWKIVNFMGCSRLFCFQKIKYNLYWKMKFLKESIYIRYVIAKLWFFFQISLLTSADSFLQRIHWKSKKDLELVSKPHFPHNFLMKILFCNYTKTGHISLPDCVYFPSYSIKCVLCFMLGHLKTSWDLIIWKFKIWLFQEWKELSNFYLFHKCSLLDIQNKLAKI